MPLASEPAAHGGHTAGPNTPDYSLKSDNWAQRLWKVVKSVAVVVAWAAIAHLVHSLGLFKAIETPGFDRLFESRSPKQSRYVAIVTISERDFFDLFQGTLPLPAPAATNLLSAIQRFKPAVIGVDVYVRSGEVTASDNNIVWPYLETERTGTSSAIREVVSGFPGVAMDPDGIVRRFARTFLLPVVTNTSSETIVLKDSLHWLITKKFCKAKTILACAAVEELDRPRGEDLIRDIRQLEINKLLDKFYFETVEASVLLQSKADFSKYFHDKIVLIGGSFREARDRYQRPGDVLFGAELLGTAIESELTGGGIHEVSEAALFGLECVLGLIIRLMLGTARGIVHLVLLVSMPFIILGSGLVLSYVAFDRLALWVNFAPVSGGLTLHHLIEVGHQPVVAIGRGLARFLRS